MGFHPGTFPIVSKSTHDTRLGPLSKHSRWCNQADPCVYYTIDASIPANFLLPPEARGVNVPCSPTPKQSSSLAAPVFFERGLVAGLGEERRAGIPPNGHEGYEFQQLPGGD